MAGALPKEYFPRVNPFERFHREEKFRKRFRMTSDSIKELAEDFGKSQFATKGTRRGGGLSHEERVTLAIRFLASGSLYSLVCDSQGVYMSTVCRSVDAFVKYMNTVKGRYIRWPNECDYGDVALQWHAIRQFPRVLAAVDGTHVALRCPSRGDKIFYSRKHFHSINVLAACGPDLRFFFINAKMPGSCHDSYVWDASALGKKTKETGFGPFVLLGDAGYALRKYMMTHFSNPRTPAEELYNASHKSTRCVVERAFGVLKQRFRVLDQSAGYIMSSPEKVSLMIIACCCLHNLAIMKGQELDINEVDLRRILAMDAEDPDIIGGNERLQRNAYLEGCDVRNKIVRDYFS